MFRLKLILAFWITIALAQPASADELLVSAAVSLSGAFKAMGAEFERAHLAVKVNLNFAASDILVKQIAEGAPVDVFASADQEAMDKAAKANLIIAARDRKSVV